MGGSRRRRPDPWGRRLLPPGFVAVVVALGACVALASCTSESVDRPSGGGSADGSPAPATRPSAPPTPSDQTTPSLDEPVPARPAVLAEQLRLSVSLLRGDHATTHDQRRAGEFQQLAFRALATRPDGLARRVLADLPPVARAMTRAGVVAARELEALSDPQPALPDWRIVAPPPPQVLLSRYRAADRRTGVPWSYLAAIHLVETRMGRIRGTSTAGARGPMQFLPSTWDLYGGGGDIDDPADAVLAAARLLRANGAPGDMARALWHYNPSGRYVRAVSEYARVIERFDFAYRGYWHWRVLFRQARGTYLLPVGYPAARAVRLTGP